MGWGDYGTIDDKLVFANICEYIAQGDKEKVGEPELIRMIFDFSCFDNPDIEYFLKRIL